MNRSFFIAGVQFRPLEAKERIRKILKGTTLILEPEPTNQYDSNAVKIIELSEKGKTHIGYVPKLFSSEVSAALEVGIDLECIVEEINPTAKFWEMIRVSIRDCEVVEAELEEDQGDK